MTSIHTCTSVCRIREPLEQSLADCLKAVFYPPGNESSVATVRFWKLLFPVLCEHLVSAAFASSTKGFQVILLTHAVVVHSPSPDNINTKLLSVLLWF